MDREKGERRFKALPRVSSNFLLLLSSKRPQREPPQSSAGVIYLDTPNPVLERQARQGRGKLVVCQSRSLWLPVLGISDPAAAPSFTAQVQAIAPSPSLSLPAPGLRLRHRNLGGGLGVGYSM